MDLRKEIEAFLPENAQERVDREGMLSFIDSQKQVLTRENTLGHFTASAWVVNRERTKALMVYHNLYDSWSWAGGHADGNGDLLSVAQKEVVEETGVVAHPVSDAIFSLEIITVDGHVKRGDYISSHLHMNVTYLLEADETQMLRVCPDENSGVRWFDNEKVVAASTEPWMQKIYQKLMKRVIKFY